MSNVWWQAEGQENVHLVLLYGWGLSAKMWRCTDEELSSHFTLHFVDLPGFGCNRGFSALSLADMAEAVLRQTSDRTIQLGWNPGRLMANQIALAHPERVQVLVTVASSPCFSAHDRWSGIKPNVLAGFQQQLNSDSQRIVERFLALQTVGIETVRQDAWALKKIIPTLPMPGVDVLNGGLEVLRTIDFRLPLQNVLMPLLRLYGYLDSLVPRRVAPMLDKLWPHSKSCIFTKAAHAPFISHSVGFHHLLVTLEQRAQIAFEMARQNSTDSPQPTLLLTPR